MVEYDVAVVGGGAVGLSTAKQLAEGSDLDVCVLEKEYHLAEHQSGRNSGVLHPGFNYEPGSLKAEFATEGTRRMKAYCEERGVPCEEFGVLVVATDDAEESRLRDLQAQADANGVETELLGPDGLAEREPHAAGQAALYAPGAASVDSQQYVYRLASDAGDAGVEFFMGYTVRRVGRTPNGYRLETDKGTVRARALVNAAGLYADRIAHGLGVGTEYQVVPFRGEYYELRPDRRSLVNSMIYPTPDPDLPFLGVHYTRRTDGKVIVGPNAVLAFGREAYRNTDFDLDELRETLTYRGLWRLLASPKMVGVAWDELNKSYRKERFVAAARRLVPELRDADVSRSYAGIRAQMVSRDGRLVKEPVVVAEDDAVHVLNAVSPGLTSSLPFGEHVAEKLLDAW
ncbi:L-2-hydroxyglutarate oxidase [Halobacteriaceae archaeon GCM10025711]